MKVSMPEIDLDKCTGCGDCVELCLSHAVGLVEGKVTIVSPADCNYCTDCETFCPNDAIRCPLEIVLLKDEPERPYEEQKEE